MKVSFTGLKNAATICIRNPLYPRRSMYTLSAEMTNDADGNDLSKYNDLLLKNPEYDISNKVNKNFVNFAFVADDIEHVGIDNSAIYLNGNLIPVNDTNLGIFTFLASMSRKLAGKNVKNFTLDRNYFLSDTFDNVVIPGHNLAEMLGEDYSKVVNYMISPLEVKNNSNIMNNNLQKIMVDYFA